MIHNATPATLWTILNKTAVAGDEVRLAPGSYGALSVVNAKRLSPGVKIVGGPEVVFTSIYINGCDGLDFVDIAVNGSVPNGYAITVANGERVTFTNTDTTPASAPAQGGPAVIFRAAKRVALVNTVIAVRGFGVALIDSVGVILRGCKFHDLAADAVNPFGSKDVLIEDNDFWHADIPAGVHGDAIQTDHTTASGRVVGLTIRNNRIRQGGGSKVQGIFVNHADDVLVEGNSLDGTMFNGIWFGDCRRVRCIDNFVEGNADMGSNIGVRQGSVEVTFADNWSSGGIVNVTETNGLANSLVTITGTVGIDARDDTKNLDRWLVRHLDPRDAEIAQLKAKVAALEENLQVTIEDRLRLAADNDALRSAMAARATADAEAMLSLQAKITSAQSALA